MKKIFLPFFLMAVGCAVAPKGNVNRTTASFEPSCTEVNITENSNPDQFYFPLLNAKSNMTYKGGTNKYGHPKKRE